MGLRRVKHNCETCTFRAMIPTEGKTSYFFIFSVYQQLKLFLFFHTVYFKVYLHLLFNSLSTAQESPSNSPLSNSWTTTGWRERKVGDTQAAECVRLFWLLWVEPWRGFPTDQTLWARHKYFTVLSSFGPPGHSPDGCPGKHLRQSLFYYTS